MKDQDYYKDPERIKLSIKLATLRKEFHINQYDLETRLNLPKGSVSKIERGVRDPTWREMNLFAELFQVSLDFLAGRSDIRTPKVTDLYTYLRNHPFTDRQLAVLEDSLYEIRKRNRTIHAYPDEEYDPENEYSEEDNPFEEPTDPENHDSFETEEPDS